MLHYIGLWLIITSRILASSSQYNIELTEDSFHQVTASDKIWFVKFYATWCGHCQNLAPKWDAAASGYSSFVKFGQVDVDQHKALAAKYKIQGFPTILVFGGDKQNPEVFHGRDEEAISREVLKQIERFAKRKMGKDETPTGVIELTDVTFNQVLEDKDPWLVAFIAPWCGHCQRLEPEWNKAAERIKHVKMGRLDATKYQNLASTYGVRGYPTIKFFPVGSKSNPREYDGGRNADDIIQWANTNVIPHIPSPEVKEITGPDTFKEVCEAHSLCVIAVLQPLWDCQSSCRNKFLEVLKKEGDKFKQQNWGWGWIEALQQPELETVLKIGEANYPALTILSVSKKSSSHMILSFSEDNIHQFLSTVAHGQGVSVDKFNDLPTINSVTPWDGEDMVIEDEEMDYQTKEEL